MGTKSGLRSWDTSRQSGKSVVWKSGLWILAPAWPRYESWTGHIFPLGLCFLCRMHWVEALAWTTGDLTSSPACRFLAVVLPAG